MQSRFDNIKNGVRLKANHMELILLSIKNIYRKKINSFFLDRVISCTENLSVVCTRVNQEIRLTCIYVTHRNAVIEFSYSGADSARDRKGLIHGQYADKAGRKFEELNFTYRRL